MVRGQRICDAVRSVGDKVPVLPENQADTVATHYRYGYEYTLYVDRITEIRKTGSSDVLLRWHGEREWYIGKFRGSYAYILEGPYEKLAAALVSLKLRE